MQGFYYANGVALSPDESYIVMAETDTITVHKVWVKGPKVGKQLASGFGSSADVFFSNQCSSPCNKTPSCCTLKQFGKVMHSMNGTVCLLQAGQSEVLIDRLPGMPDGVDASPTGGYCEHPAAAR